MRRGPVLASVAALAASGAAGCGSDDHPNEPRPPAPIEVTAKVDDEKVDVQPSKFGAGLVVMTISNQSGDPVELAVDGPTGGTGPTIAPGQPGNFKFDFEEGEYVVSAGEESRAREAQLEVGPERASSQNDLLLP
ncbi:MAG TPA: hypothetical protein VFY99_01415 [Solirubrobacterales bacterium]